MPRHLDAVEQALDGASLAQVLVTHGHVDHASGAPALARTHSPRRRFRKMPWPDRDAKWPVAWQPLADGDVIEAGDTTLTAVHTPGHAPDHLCFWHAATRTLFCGDLAMQGTHRSGFRRTCGGDLARYLASLERVLALEPRAHASGARSGDRRSDAAAASATSTHRREREEQVLEALRAGDCQRRAIVAARLPRA